MNTKVEKYKPSIAGRIARILIPFMQKVLSQNLYIFLYDFLYKNYKWILRKSYLIEIIRAYISCDKNRILRAKLTWKLLPFTLGGSKALENAFDIISIIENDNIPGVLIECGVAEGGTAAMLALANKKVGKFIRTKYFFDSYEGLPEPTKEDYIDGKSGNFIRPLPKGSCLGTLEQVTDLMHNTLGMTKDEVHLIKGWFQDTVPLYKDKIGNAIAVLRLDGDWYESTKIPLENFYDKLSFGGIVIIDDYFTCFGAKLATDEYMINNGISTQLNHDGRGGIWFKKM